MSLLENYPRQPSEDAELAEPSTMARPETLSSAAFGPQSTAVGVDEELFILIPALDEEGGIGRVLDGIPLEELESMDCRVSVVVVDGVSEDATRDIARRKGARVFVQAGRGKGNGVRQALDSIFQHPALQRKTASVSIVMLDADGTYPAEDIPRFLAALRAGHDVVIGSRMLGRIDEGAMSNLNRLGNRGLSLLASVLYGMPVTDVCTGMWGLSGDFLRRCELRAKGFELEAEIFAMAALSRARIAEVPIAYHRRIGTPKLVPLRTGLQIGWWLLHERLNGERAAPWNASVQHPSHQGAST